VRRAARWDVLERASGRRLRLALDLTDAAARLDPLGARECDVYLKRSFVRADLTALAPRGARCVFLPLGLNHACLTPGARGLLAGAALRRAVSTLRAGRGAAAAARGFAADLRLLAGLPPPEAFENFAPDDRADKVLFQTRVWAPEPSTDDLPALNRERAELVRALRAAFPEAFVGGVMADAFSSEHFPDVVTSRSLHRAAYAALSRRASIGVYSRGIHHSLAFKLSEYLASGLCIVSSPLPHELPEPLVPGRHFLEYRTPAECVAAVRHLRERPEEAARMRQANLDYYRTNLAPAAAALSALERSFRAARG